MRIRNLAAIAACAIVPMTAVLGTSLPAHAAPAPRSSIPVPCVDPLAKINDVTHTEPGNVGLFGHLAIFNVTLSKKPCHDVTIRFRTVDGTAKAGSDYTANSGQVKFSAANGSTNALIGVNVSDDSVCESQERFFVRLSSPVNTSLSDTVGVGTIPVDFNDCLH